MRQVFSLTTIFIFLTGLSQIASAGHQPSIQADPPIGLYLEGEQGLIPLPLASTRVRGELSGFVTRVSVTQVYVNPYDGVIEASYIFPLPDQAAVTSMVMHLSDRDVVAEIHPKQEAERIVRRTGYYRALLGLLEVQLRSENLGAALGLCDRLLAERPDDTGMLERKASLLAQLPGRQQEALDTIQSAIDLSPRPSFFYQRGCLRLDLGDYANAIEDFQRAKQAGGAGPGSLDLLMAEAYLGLNNIDLARVYYESAKNKASGVKPADAIRLDAIASRLAEEQSK